jgi:hypothetical protein
MSIRFISSKADHKVLLVPGRQLTDPLTGLPGQQIPNRYVHFKSLVYEATNDDEAYLLLQKWHQAEERRWPHSFWVHPSDLEAANELWEERKTNQTPVVPDANYVKSLEDQIRELKAMIMEKGNETEQLKPKKPRGRPKAPSSEMNNYGSNQS